MSSMLSTRATPDVIDVREHVVDETGRMVWWAVATLWAPLVAMSALLAVRGLVSTRLLTVVPEGGAVGAAQTALAVGVTALVAWAMPRSRAHLAVGDRRAAWAWLAAPAVPALGLLLLALA